MFVIVVKGSLSELSLGYIICSLLAVMLIVLMTDCLILKLSMIDTCKVCTRGWWSYWWESLVPTVILQVASDVQSKTHGNGGGGVACPRLVGGSNTLSLSILHAPRARVVHCPTSLPLSLWAYKPHKGTITIHICTPHFSITRAVPPPCLSLEHGRMATLTATRHFAQDVSTVYKA